jgi:hypothetical protein
MQFCCWRYRPTKVRLNARRVLRVPHLLQGVFHVHVESTFPNAQLSWTFRSNFQKQWSVMQYVIIRPGAPIY